jgi:hypothetical protein
MVNYCLEIVLEKLTLKNYCKKFTGGRSVKEDGGILSDQIAAENGVFYFSMLQ